ncbi:MAG: hypothetical protein AAF704_12945 [Cyanobacteria bacterium P01_D01_bin.123]
MSERSSREDAPLSSRLPSPLALRSLLILTLTCTFLGLEFVVEGIRHGAVLTIGTSRVPMYLPGGLLVAVGALNVWRWRGVSERVKREQSD